MKTFAISVVFIIIIASQHFINWMWRSDWNVDPNHVATENLFKVGITVISFILLVFLSVVALSWYKEE